MRGFSWRRLFLGTAGLVAQFPCRLFLLVQALIFGVLVGFLELCFEVFGTCRSGFGVLFLVMLVLITVGVGTLGGSGVDTVLLPGPVSPHLWNFLDKLLVLFCYPDGSVAALLAGDLPLRYCSARFAWKLPTWRLLDRGHVRDLIVDSVNGARLLGCVRMGGDLFPPPVSRAGGSFDGRVLGCVKRIRLNRKTPAHLARIGNCMSSKSRSRVWKRLRVSGVHWCSVCDFHVFHECHHGGVGSSLGYRVGVG